MSRGRQLVQHDRRTGSRLVAGADEAGRGCLAGPLVAASVLLDLDRIGPREVRALGELDDSKRHAHEARERLLPVVMRLAERVTVVTRCVEALDARGLHRTNLEALASALRGSATPDALCLVDGFSLPGLELEHRRVVGGDAKSASIAASSIVAKVTRDRYMRRAALAHPHWGFDVHMGYGTPAHRDAIARHGLSPLHRRSFRSAAYALAPAVGADPAGDDPEAGAEGDPAGDDPGAAVAEQPTVSPTRDAEAGAQNAPSR